MQPPSMPGGRLARWKELGADFRAAQTTLWLAVLLTLVQLILAANGGFEGVPSVYDNLGLSRGGILSGRVWEFLSYGLIHGNWAHLLLNVGCLLAFGPRVERIGGGVLVLKVMLGGLTMGGLFHLVLGGGGAEAPCLVGASGGIVALLLWLTGVSPGSQMWPLRVSGRSLGAGMLLASGLLALMNPVLKIPVLAAWGTTLDGWMGGGLFQASHACHFGGATAGWLAAKWTLRPRVTLKQLQDQRAQREESKAGE